MKPGVVAFPNPGETTQNLGNGENGGGENLESRWREVETRVTTIEERTKNIQKNMASKSDVADLKTAIEKANVWALCGTVGGFALLISYMAACSPQK